MKPIYDEIIHRGRARGYLTYQEVNDLLPADRDCTTEEIDALLLLLEREGIELSEVPPPTLEAPGG
jgi:RNA polymerase primary sigma factor